MLRGFGWQRNRAIWRYLSGLWLPGRTSLSQDSSETQVEGKELEETPPPAALIPAAPEPPTMDLAKPI